jgi:UDP-glucuronate 4-epimerase
MPEHFLVTGAFGCIGAWTCQTLVQEGAHVTGFDLGTSRHRLELIMTPEELCEINFVHGDVTDLAALERVLDEHDITNVVHLAALLIPLARADPPRGAAVNVCGTVNAFEAAKRRGISGLAYASSAAVYNRADGIRVAEDAEGHPITHYGVHKQANEGTARVYWLDDRIPSVGLRPDIVYGPGRDQGMTADPTLAMAAAARGDGYHISFGGRAQFQYAPDAARAFINAARDPGEGAAVRNLGGPVTEMSELVGVIEAVAPEVRGKITFDAGTLLPLPEVFEAAAPVTTPLERGVRETIETLRAGQ